MRKLKTHELSRLDPAHFQVTKKHPFVMVLDNIRSAHNVGAAFRIADAFLVEKLYLCGITACPPHREIHKTSLGAESHIVWEGGADTSMILQQLKQEGYYIVGLEQTDISQSLATFSYQERRKYALVFGQEVFGVQEAVLAACDLHLEIPQHGVKHSLNVSVSRGIVLWEFVKKYHS